MHFVGIGGAGLSAIARLMLERVVITVAGTSEQVVVVCHWAGGVQTHHSLRRPVAHVSQLSTHAALRQRIAELHAAGTKPPAIAAALNVEGWKPAKRRETFTAAMVRDLLHRQGVPVSAIRWSSCTTRPSSAAAPRTAGPAWRRGRGRRRIRALGFRMRRALGSLTCGSLGALATEGR